MEETKSEYQILLENKAKGETTSFIIRIIVVILCFLMLALYLLTPISSLSIMNLTGGIYLNKEDVLSLIHHEETDSIYSLDEGKSEELLNAHPLIENAEIKLTPFSFEVYFDECAPSATYDGEVYHTLGEKFTKEEYDNEIINAYLNEHQLFLAEYENSPENISKKTNSNLLLITALTNKKDKIVHYIDVINDERTFVFYYYTSENLPYIRCEWYYQAMSPVDFSSCVTKKCIDELVVSLYKDTNIAVNKRVINEKEIAYYDVTVRIIEEKGNLVLFQYDV